MRAIASGLVYANRLSRPMAVVWREDCELNAPFDLLFKVDHLPFAVARASSLKYHLYYEAPRKRNAYVSKVFTFLKGSKIINIDDFESVSRLPEILSRHKGDVIINSGLQFADFDHEFFSSIFTFSDVVTSTKQQILRGSHPEYAVQIRRTDNAESIKNSPVELFEGIIDKGISDNPSVVFFLATDDQGTKQYLSEKYPSNIIVNPNEASRNTRKGMVDAAAELCIMAECSTIYGSFWSSFSAVAALYGDKKIIVVKKEHHN